MGNEGRPGRKPRSDDILRTEGGVPKRLGDLILPSSGAVIENEGIDETLPNED